MAVKIKLKRLGKIRQPQYRIIVADARTKRDGRAIEEIGRYEPKQEPSLIQVDSARAQYWLSVGAQPTEPVLALLKVTGDWQKFKGLPGAEGTLRTAAPKADKTAVYEKLLGEAKSDEGDAKPAKKAAARRAEKPAEKAEKPAEKAEKPAEPVEAPEAPAAEAPAAAEEPAEQGSEQA